MKFQIVPAHELSLGQQADVFNAAFAGYVAGSFELDSGRLAAFITAHGVDLCHSRFARNHKQELVSFGYINRTGNVSRLAGMGTVASARRTGAAAFVLSRLLDEAKKRSDTAIMLEVIEQNPPAVRLYQAHGFQILDHLYGWRSSGDSVAARSNDLREISILEAMELPTPIHYPALPWQISRHAAAKVVSGRAFAFNSCALVISEAATPAIRLHAYFGSDDTNWDSLRKLTALLLAEFPNHELYAPPMFPERFGTRIFEPLKFCREPLNQFLMRKDL